MAKHVRAFAAASLLAVALLAGGAAAKDESRLGNGDQLAQQPPAADAPPTLPLPPAEDGVAPEVATPEESPPTGPDDLSLGEIPEVKTIELTTDIAKRAIDSYVQLRVKYDESDFESYDNLQQFVDENPQGKAFEADVKAAGFATADDWNTAITTLSFAYTGAIDDPTADINEQIKEIDADTALAQDMKDRMVTSLRAMIPSPNNLNVVGELMKDPAYAEKLKQLDVEEE